MHVVIVVVVQVESAEDEDDDGDMIGDDDDYSGDGTNGVPGQRDVAFMSIPLLNLQLYSTAHLHVEQAVISVCHFDEDYMRC